MDQNTKEVNDLWYKFDKNMNHCISLLPYLGGDMYKNLLDLAAEHDQAADEDEIRHKKSAKKMRRDADLTKQNNPVIHKLFVRILKLI
jgi:hypothetical protein